ASTMSSSSSLTDASSGSRGAWGSGAVGEGGPLPCSGPLAGPAVAHDGAEEADAGADPQSAPEGPAVGDGAPVSFAAAARVRGASGPAGWPAPSAAGVGALCCGGEYVAWAPPPAGGWPLCWCGTPSTRASTP